MDLNEMMESIEVDMATTVHRFGDNKALLEKFVRKFLDDRTFEQIERAVKDEDYPAIENTAHTLKGVAANLGFQDLSDLCNELVWDVRNHTEDKIDGDFAAAKERYEVIISAIKRLG